MSSELFHSDYHQWAIDQFNLLVDRKFDALDIENLIEEVRDMVRWPESELLNRLSQLFLHLLKWEYQSERRSRSWKNSIEHQRDRIALLLKKNPSLKSSLKSIMEDAFELARKDAARETFLPIKTFPKELPFEWDDMLKEDWFPN